MNQTLRNPFENITPPTRQVQQFPQQPQYQQAAPMKAQRPEQKKKSKKKYLLLLLLLLLIPTIWLVKDAFIGDVDLPSFPGINWDTNQGIGDLKGKSKEERVAALNEKVAEGMLNFSMNTNPIFESGTSMGTLMINNSASNRYPQLIEIYTKDSNTLVYSGAVDIGNKVEKSKLLVDLPKGEYECIAHFSALNRDTGEKLGTVKANIKISILR